MSGRTRPGVLAASSQPTLGTGPSPLTDGLRTVTSMARTHQKKSLLPHPMARGTSSSSPGLSAASPSQEKAVALRISLHASLLVRPLPHHTRCTT